MEAQTQWPLMLKSQLAELMVLQNAHATAALKECWKHRLQVLKKDLGYDGAPMLEQLLIQQAALCWLKLNLLELSYSNTMAQSDMLTLGMFVETASSQVLAVHHSLSR